MKRALMVTSVASMIKQFNMQNIQLLQEMDYDVTIATNFKSPGTIPVEESKELWNQLKEKNVSLIQIDFHRNPMSKANIKSLQKLIKITNNGNFDLIHCQSPIGGVLTRIAARKVKKTGTKVIYTAHGFHFYKGAPLLNWAIYYPMERVLAKFTDILITINKEDYKRAQSFNTGKVYLIHGVGLKLEKFKKPSKLSSFRKSIGISDESKLLLSVGELNKNKNHEVVIKAISKIDDPSIHYVICGNGEYYKLLEELIAKLGLQKQVHLLGYKKDISEIYKAADIFVFPSLREGLSVALMEAMASGLPIIASNIRGNSDLIDKDQGGFLFHPKNENILSEYIIKLVSNLKLRKKFGIYNKYKIKDFSLETVLKELMEVYQDT